MEKVGGMADEAGKRGGQAEGGQGRSVSTGGAKYLSLTCDEHITEHGKPNVEYQVINTLSKLHEIQSI